MKNATAATYGTDVKLAGAAGCVETSYQSKTELIELGQYMDGSFTFITGTRDNPRGPMFAVACPRLKFDHPGCVY